MVFKKNASFVLWMKIVLALECGKDDDPRFKGSSPNSMACPPWNGKEFDSYCDAVPSSRQ